MANQEKSAAELYREERKKRIAKAAKSNSRKHISDKAQKRIVSTIINVSIQLSFLQQSHNLEIVVSIIVL